LRAQEIDFVTAHIQHHQAGRGPQGYTGAILAEIEKAGFKIVSIKRMSISKAQAEGFYYVHAARPFFGELTEFMSSGPIFPIGSREGQPPPPK